MRSTTLTCRPTLFASSGRPDGTWQRGPTSKYYHETNYSDIEERFKRAEPVDNAIRRYDDLDHSYQGTDPAAAQS